MKLIRISLSCFLLLMLSHAAFPQDQRTIQTKVADLLARFPANDNVLLNKLMSDMSGLGEEGLKKICDQVIPAGSGDDTKNRFAIESYSRYLTAKGREKDRLPWEKICIGYARSAKDNGVKDFFMKQLQWVGGDASVDAMKEFLTSKEVCEPALAVILASDSKNAEAALAGSLKNKDLPCAAATMNALARMKSNLAVNEYIQFLSVIDVNTRASALNALAMSGSKAALDALYDEAKKVEYHWEPTGAVAALLNFADQAGANGDVATMDKITKLVMSKTKDDASIQNKTVALGIYTKYHGIDAMPLLYKAAAHSNWKFRAAAMRFSLGIEGPEAVNGWLNYYKRAINAAKPQLIAMLGERGDKLALPVINEALSSKDQAERIEAAQAVAAISKSEAISALVSYMVNFKSEKDQKAAKEALMTVMRNEDIRFLIPVLKEGSTPAVRTSLELLAWKRDPKYFNDVFALTSSSNDTVKTAAIKALPELSGSGNQQQLIDLLMKTDNPGQVADLQNAVAVAATQIDDPEKRSQEVIQALRANGNNASAKIKLVPVLAKTGGREALSVVLNEFENGNADMRDASFKSLTGWRDYSASSALYEILASGNKTFEGQAFDGYIRQVRSSGLPAEQKVLLFRKLMPYAASAQRKNAILAEMGRLNTYQALFFVAGYLDNPETSAAAARSAMTIALPNSNGSTGMSGTMVRNILTSAAAKLKGSESDYEREQVNKYLAEMPGEEGFKPLFNGKDLTGWKGLVDDPIKRSKMKPAELAKRQAEADKKVPENWTVKDGCIWFNGKGNNLCTVDQYADFEMLVDWKISKEGDSGIYLRGTPQVQIWDTSRTEVGAQVGSGGLYNNQKNPSKPLKVADNPVGEWNTFRIVMIGEKVSVWLNGELVVDNVTLENYWDRSIPIFPKEQLELQAHGTDLAFRDIYVREISDNQYNLTKEEVSGGFVSLFNGRNLDNWVGNKKSYIVEDGNIVVKPGDDSGGNLYTEKEYSDFIFRFEFQLTPAANNGLGIRAPLQGDAAYVGMELQILDDTAPVYADLQPYQYHGSVYGVIPAKKGFQKPVGEWNYEEVEVRGTHIKITLNGNVIVDGDIAEARDKGTMDHKEHPGLKNQTGHIGFLGHGSELKFRNIRIKDLTSNQK
ncbi:MAG TPA: family 16 glycoside hydrolase [Bacteroidales bacterium]|nr:family 16 glycoside hydrolase [Bacteroidales bacterium]